MIKVQFFASIREALGTESIAVETVKGNSLVSDLIEQLCEEKPEWGDVLMDSKVLVAINQEMTHQGAKLESDDEVALFPPVTGG
ncbi:MAG: molybdopterin converting factor subunit 1 [Pseudomonadales bacterium]|nr:molybdopterin converting factor subunit 1 [Pseudomonadales bacterium]